MVVTVAEPLEIQGEQAVFLADITLDILTDQVKKVSKDETEEIRYLIRELEEQFIGVIRQTKEECRTSGRTCAACCTGIAGRQGQCNSDCTTEPETDAESNAGSRGN